MEFHHDQEQQEDDDEEMPLPINTTYGHNHIVPLPLHHHKPPFIDPSITLAPPRLPPVEAVVKYKECLRNHAASMGGKARDGCGEFMPSGEEGTLEALTCAVCNCHRNFHRKEVEGDNHHHHHPTVVPPHLKRFDLGNGRNLILQGHNSKGALGTESLGYNHNSNAGSLVPFRGPPPMVMPYNMGSGSFSESDHIENGGGTSVGGFMSIYPPTVPLSSPTTVVQQQTAKKRYRTKFTQDQKEKMFKFAESTGWKIQRQEESVVQNFCQEIGIKRRVLKVWMHNNKQNLAKNTNSIYINPPQQPN